MIALSPTLQPRTRARDTPQTSLQRLHSHDRRHPAPDTVQALLMLLELIDALVVTTNDGPLLNAGCHCRRKQQQQSVATCMPTRPPKRSCQGKALGAGLAGPASLRHVARRCYVKWNTTALQHNTVGIPLLYKPCPIQEALTVSCRQLTILTRSHCSYTPVLRSITVPVLTYLPHIKNLPWITPGGAVHSTEMA
jgi:hypothetical protein